MNLKNAVMNAVSLGGHAKLEAVKLEYDSAYREYEFSRAECAGLLGAVQSHVDDLGKVVISGFDAAKTSRRILKNDGRVHLSVDGLPSHPRGKSRQNPGLVAVDRVISTYDTSLSAAAGAGIGAASAAGSWSLVALVGSASTGTAISTLSGVAATNATFAWFGGGALAAGGAGMAGGTLVLGGIALAPVVAFAAWHSRAKAKDIGLETERVRRVRHEADLAALAARESLRQVESSLARLTPAAGALVHGVAIAKSLLFPTWGWSLLVRHARRLLGGEFYTATERATVSELEATLLQFVDCFRDLADGDAGTATVP